MKRYQLRYAAGTYWLSDTNPEGSVIQRPLELNETATEIWKMLEDGKNTEEIAEFFSEGNEGQKKEIQNDIEQFIEQLRQNNIDI